MLRYYEPRIRDRNGDLSKSWFVEFYYRNPQTGKFKRFRWYEGINRYQNKKHRREAARYVAREISKALEKGWSPFEEENDYSNAVNILQAIREYVAYKQKTTKLRSYYSYKNALDLLKTYFQNKQLTNLQVHELDKQAAYRVMNWLLDRNISPSTHNNYLTQYRVFYNWCVERNYTSRNPFSQLKPLKKTQNISIYTSQEADLLRQHLARHKPQLFFFTEFIYYCALRPYELIQLKVHQVSHQQILVPGNVSKNGRQETIAVPAAFQDKLKGANLGQYPSSYWLFGQGIQPGPDKMHRNQPMRHFKSARRALGLRDELRMYHFKDLGAIRAIEAGISLRDLRDHLRHTSIAVTEVYLRKLKSVASAELVQKFPKF